MIALLIDIGNSRIKWRVARIAASRPPTWLNAESGLAVGEHARIATLFAENADLTVDAVWCSNVASDGVEASLREAVASTWTMAKWHAVRPVARQCGVVNGYRDPTRLGPDRRLALIGARARFPGRTVLVCSFGTATTIDLLVSAGAEARFVGGLILPGFEAMRGVLASSTARLPLAAGSTVDFAQDTDDAITSGIAAAQLGAVERAWRIALRDIGPTICVLAGGAAFMVAEKLAVEGAVEAHDLVLTGLAEVANEAQSTIAIA